MNDDATLRSCRDGQQTTYWSSRDRFGLRPGVNVAIVVVFGAIYLIFLRHF